MVGTLREHPLTTEYKANGIRMSSSQFLAFVKNLPCNQIKVSIPSKVGQPFELEGISEIEAHLPAVKGDFDILCDSFQISISENGRARITVEESDQVTGQKVFRNLLEYRNRPLAYLKFLYPFSLAFLYTFSLASSWLPSDFIENFGLPLSDLTIIRAQLMFVSIASIPFLASFFVKFGVIHKVRQPLKR